MPLLLIFQAQLISLQEMELYPILVGLIIRDISRKQVIFFGHWKQVLFCGLFYALWMEGYIYCSVKPATVYSVRGWTFFFLFLEARAFLVVCHTWLLVTLCDVYSYETQRIEKDSQDSNFQICTKSQFLQALELRSSEHQISHLHPFKRRVANLCKILDQSRKINYVAYFRWADMTFIVSLNAFFKFN